MGVVSEDRVLDLPGPVRRSLVQSGVVGKPIPDVVTVQQRGRIRSSREGRWLGFVATERFTLDPLSFEWNASLKIAGVGVGRAVDTLADGRGSMRVRLLGLFPVVDASGPEMDQGSLMRWLNESMWFPAVWATDLVTWSRVDEFRAIARVSVAGLDAEAELRFDSDGRLVDFRADRYRDVDGDFVLTPWSTPLSAHQKFGRVELPSAGGAMWLLDDGEFEYIQIKVLNVRYSRHSA